MNESSLAPDDFSHLHIPADPSMNATLPALAALTLGILLAAPTGCERPSDLSTEAAGHAISARIQGPHSVVSEDHHAVITGPFAKVTIERAQVKVNDGRWTAIPEGVPVSLDMAPSRLRIQAGNVTIRHSVR
jgi:hypothetical protein